MNNMGGYKSVTLYPYQDISVSMSDTRALINSYSNAIVLPLTEGKSSISSDDKEDGSYEHLAEISLKAGDIDAAVLKKIRQICRQGGILVATDFLGRSFLFGDKQYPLVGTIEEVHGRNHADLHFFQLNLSCECLHPELLVD